MKIKPHIALLAVVSASSIAWLSGFASSQFVKPVNLAQDAVKIEVADTAAAAPAAAASSDVAAAPAAAAPAAVVSVLEMLASADVARGKTLAKACTACHNFDKGGKNGVGPNQWDLVGRKKESVAGFKYSGKLAAQGGDVWTYAELNKFLTNPKAYAPGNKMAYAGIKKPEDRAAVLAYLRSLSDAPKPVPSAAEIADEKAGK
jgi:cytochrome c